MDELKEQRVLAICSGCGIGEAVDVDRIIRMAEKEAGDLHCIRHPALCSEAGLQDLHRMLREKNAGQVVVAACSPRVMAEKFRMIGRYVERVNLREQVTWVMEPGREETLMCAEDQVRMALAKLGAITDSAPYVPENPSSEILVVGGGVAGLHAALEGVSAGYRVHLVERTNRLGGYAGRIHKMVPGIGENGKLREPDTDALAEKLMSHPEAEVYLNTTVERIAGEPGSFSVTVENDGKKEISVGSVVVSTGWKVYEPGNLGHLGYGRSESVKTLEEFEHYVAGGDVPGRVLFVLCAGSRDEKHLPYCSAYCCTAALKQALYVRESNPGAQVFIIYRDIRTTGFQEEFYKMVQADDSIFLTKGTVSGVIPEGRSLRTTVSDTLLGDEIIIESDMVVLATGMVPSGTESLHLQYRLGEGLPGIEYDFCDSHFTCFPYETRRTGIYAAGTVWAPMDLESSAEDGAGAMMKAIQCIECVKRGEAVHPRSGDLTFPGLYMERCTDCKRCTEECPFGSYDETEKGTPLPHPARCRRCGICIGSCPERVIGFSDFSINSISAMIKAVHVPGEFGEKPRVLVFLCENDAYPALDAAGVHRLKLSPFVRIIPVRCLGSINKVWISDALSHGYDGILQIGCKPGDDTQCHFIHGSELTEQRGENLQETLETMMLEPERIRTRFVEITDHHLITTIINEYIEELQIIGPNPFKGM
jgi:quinone-modifying oxidoreductase subunit QmoB